MSPRKEPNTSTNNKLRTSPLTEEEKVDEENDPGHEPPQESVVEPEQVLGSTSALASEQNIFDTISANIVERRTVDRFLPGKDSSKGSPAEQPLLLEGEDPDEKALSCAGERSDRSSQSGSGESFTVGPQLGNSWTLRAGEDIGGSTQKNGLAWHCI